MLLDLIRAALRELASRSGRRGRSKTRAAGDRAEEFALRFLKKAGFRPLMANVGDERGELDLVGRFPDFDGVVVIEVRARKEGGVRTPREAVDRRKQKQVVRTARRVLKRKGVFEPLRFDVVGVYLDDEGEPARAEHFPAAFR